MIDAKFVRNTGQYTQFNDIKFIAKPFGKCDIETIDTTDRVGQDIVKILQTPSGGFPYVQYGCMLPLIMLQPLKGLDLLGDVQQSIIDAIKYLIAREPSTSSTEQIGSINDCTVSQDSSEPRQIDVTLSITTKAGVEKNYSVSV